MKLGAWLQNPGNVRGIITIVILIIFATIVTTFIINPKALNPAGNPAIGYVVGAVMTRLGDVFVYYFNQDKQKDGAKS